MFRRSCDSCELAKFCDNLVANPGQYAQRLKQRQPEASAEAIDFAIGRTCFLAMRVMDEKPNCEGWGSAKLFALMPLAWLLSDTAGDYVNEVKVNACQNPWLQTEEGLHWVEEIDIQNPEAAHQAFLAQHPEE